MEETKITTVKKVKSPKRVGQGKRLAAISREAKARKAAERAKVEECVKNANMLYVAVGVLGVVGLRYGVCNFFWKKEGPQQEVQQPQQVEQPKKKILSCYKIKEYNVVNERRSFKRTLRCRINHTWSSWCINGKSETIER